jgi:hypothetical protein
MQIVAKQAIKELLGVFKLPRPLAISHRCPPPCERGRDRIFWSGFNILPAFIDLFLVNREPPILFGKFVRLFDSFIAQDRREMRG